MMTTRMGGVLVGVTAVAIYACAGAKGTSGGSGAGGGTSIGGSGVGGRGSGTGGSGLLGGGGSGLHGGGGGGGSGTIGGAGSGAPAGTAGSGAAGDGTTGTGGADGASTCPGGMQGTTITDCGYPSMSNTPLTSVVFNESEVLRGVVPSGGSPVATVQVFYNDEHALTLGVRQVVVKTAAGTMMTDYPVSPLATDPGMATNPQTGTNMLIGDQSGLDVSLRPMWPALFITDITNDPNSRVGDWQQGGVPMNPTDVFGSWKAAVRTVDKTVTPSLVSIQPDADPVKNNWNLAGGDPVPAGLTDQGWGAEARWSVPLAAGHSYRLQVMVHDGDQRKVGGDSGEACVIFCAGGSKGAGGAGGYVPPPMCPVGTAACGGGGIDRTACPSGTVCANGCCLPIVQ